MRSLSHVRLLTLLTSFALVPSIFALTYPASTPTGETTGGSFYPWLTNHETWLSNIFTSKALCSDMGKAVGGFNTDGTPICMVPGAATSFAIPGSVAGDTLRYNGTDWIRNNFLYNDGTKIGIGTFTPSAKLDVNGDALINNLTIGRGGGNSSMNTAIGYQALNSAPGASVYNTAIGYQSLYGDTGGGFSTAVGFQTLYNNTGFGGTALGSQALYNNTTAYYNTALGRDAMYSTTTGGDNTAVGVASLRSNINGYRNTSIGFQSLYNAVNGIQNTVIGNEAGKNLTAGNNNIFLGYNTQPNISNTASDQLNIGNWIYGNNGNIGIGVSSPLTNAKLEVNGRMKITDGTQALGKVLTSDASGLATWQTPTASTVTATGVTGGTQNYVTKFGTGGVGLYSSQIFDNGTAVGVATTTLGSEKLNINGQIKITDGTQSLGKVLTSDATGLASWQTPIVSAIIGGQTNYITRWLTSTTLGTGSLFDNGTQVGVGTNTPLAGMELDVNGDGRITGDLTVQGKLIVDKLVNRTVTNISVSGSLLPDAAAPQAYRDIGSSTQKWNNLYLSGQLSIAGGSPGAGKILTSDATGLATWSSMAPGVTATGVTGGTQNYVTKFGTGGVGLYISQIFDTGTGVGIGTTSPTSMLDVNGTISSTKDAKINGLTVGIGPGNNSASTAFGRGVLNSELAGWGGNTAIGYGNLAATTQGMRNVAIGMTNLPSNTTGNDNTAIGNFDLFRNTTGIQNIALGQSALYMNLTGNDNIALGISSLGTNTGGINNVAIGSYALQNNVGSNNIAIGRAGSSLTSGNGNIFIGNGITPNISNTGSNQLNIGNWIYGNGGNIGIGVSTPLTSAKLEVAGQVKITGGTPGAGKILTSDATGLATWSSMAPGVTATGVTGGTQNYVPKFGTGGVGLYSSQIFDDGTNIGIGYATPTSKLEVWSGATTLLHFRGTNNVGLGIGALKYSVTGNANTGMGAESLFTITTGYSNSAFGYRSMRQATTAFNNTAIGQESLYNINGGSWNSAVGYQALYSNTSGTNNVAEGPQALYNLSTGNNNVAIGYQAIRAVAGSSVSANVGIGYQALFSTTASNQVAIGYQALYANTSGANNIALGAFAGSGITTGANNIALGYNAQVVSPTASNQLSIGNWIYGSGGDISIGRTTVSSGAYQLEVEGGYVNSASGYCIANTCIANWTGIFDAINGQGNYLPKWNLSGTGLVASRVSDNGTDIAISSGALQQVLITPANQSQYNQVLISASGGVLKQGLTTREKLRIFAYSNYGVSNDAVSVQTLCFDTSTSTNCKPSGDPATLTNVPNFNQVDPKSYTGGIGEYIPATSTNPGYFISNFTGTYMVVTNYIFSSTSLNTSDNGCNVFPYYSLYDSGVSLPPLKKYDNTAPVIFTIGSSTSIANVYASTNLSLPAIKTTRVGSQFVSNVFMTPGQRLLMTVGVQSCTTRADQSMALVANDQRKMILSITEL